MSIDRRKIDLSEPIKTLGEYTVVYKPHPDVPIDLKVLVLSDDPNAPTPTSAQAKPAEASSDTEQDAEPAEAEQEEV